MPFPNAHDRVSNITPKAECRELGELHTTARLGEMPLMENDLVIGGATYHRATNQWHTELPAVPGVVLKAPSLGTSLIVEDPEGRAATPRVGPPLSGAGK